MGVTSYRKEVSPGVFKTFYRVTAEGVNKYTRKRIQKRRIGITSKPKADGIFRELWVQCREERPDGPRIERWGELTDAYLRYVESQVRSETNKTGFSPKTLEKKKSRFVHVKEWNDSHLDLITPKCVKETLDALEMRGLAGRALTSEIQKEVRCVFGYAVDCGYLKVNPLAEMTKREVPKRKKKALNPEEVKILLSEARQRNHPYFFIWLFSIALGLRRSELAGLKWSDIDFDNGLITVQRQNLPKEGIVDRPKDKEERTVAIPASVVTALKECRLSSQSEFVVDIDCNQWKGGHQAAVLREFCREIGIKEVTHHRLRATHITLALISGIPIGIVKENVGHAKLSTTDEYFSSSGIQMRGQMDGLKINVPTGQEAEVVPLMGAAR
ncbi:MAG: tyrosine-type recombinase/integrase [Bacteriovoracia bacterium]